MVTTCLNITVPASSTSAPLGYKMDDPVLRWFGPNQGFWFDFASADCFARQANPVDTDPVVNYCNNASTIRNGAFSIVGGVTFTAGKGIYYGGVTAPGNILAVANAFEAIQADANKAWMSIRWAIMPSSADWPAAGVGRSIEAAGNYGSAADLFTMYITTNGSSKDLVIRPSTATGTTTAIVLAGAGATFSGKIVQIFAWRTAAGVTTVRIKATDGTVQTSTPVTLTANTANLSGLTWRFGTMTSAQTANNFSASGSWGANDIGSCKWTLFRGGILSTANLPTSQTPTMIADADYTYTTARGVYS